MTQGPLNWLYPAIALTLSTIALLLILWALFSDRARGRKRCPRCWYDMAAGTLTCPECGHTARSEAALLRTRRRWGWVAAGLLLLVAAQSVRMTPRAIARGTRGLIPTFVLARWWPMDIDGWLQSGSLAPLAWSRDPIIEEWFARGDEEMSIADAAAWLGRVDRRIRELQSGSDPDDLARGSLRVYDLRAVRAILAPHFGFDPTASGPAGAQLGLWMTMWAAPDEWVDHGGSTAELFATVSGVVVRAPAHVHAEVALLRDIMARAVLADTAGSDDDTWPATLAAWRLLDRAAVPPIHAEDSVATILAKIAGASTVACDTMDSAYFRSVIAFDEPRGLELPEGSAVVALDALRNLLRETTDAAACEWSVVRGGVRLASADEQQRAVHLRMFNVAPRLAAMSLDQRLIAAERLAQAIREACEPDAWVESGGEHRLEHVADRIIVRAPLPLICKVALYLERTAGDPITPTPAGPADAGPPAD